MFDFIKKTCYNVTKEGREERVKLKTIEEIKNKRSELDVLYSKHLTMVNKLKDNNLLEENKAEVQLQYKIIEDDYFSTAQVLSELEPHEREYVGAKFKIQEALPKNAELRMQRNKNVKLDPVLLKLEEFSKTTKLKSKVRDFIRSKSLNLLREELKDEITLSEGFSSILSKRADNAGNINEIKALLLYLNASLNIIEIEDETMILGFKFYINISNKGFLEILKEYDSVKFNVIY